MKSPALSLGLAVFVITAPPRAEAGVNDNVRICRDAIETSGEIDASVYRVKFRYIRGGGVRVVGFRLYPRNKDDERLKARCTIERGVITNLEFLGA